LRVVPRVVTGARARGVTHAVAPARERWGIERAPALHLLGCPALELAFAASPQHQEGFATRRSRREHVATDRCLCLLGLRPSCLTPGRVQGRVPLSGPGSIAMPGPCARGQPRHPAAPVRPSLRREALQRAEEAISHPLQAPDRPLPERFESLLMTWPYGPLSGMSLATSWTKSTWRSSGNCAQIVAGDLGVVPPHLVRQVNDQTAKDVARPDAEAVPVHRAGPARWPGDIHWPARRQRPRARSGLMTWDQA
jgi:hypothetical protein